MAVESSALVTSAVHPAVAQSMEVYGRLQAVRSVLAPDLNDQELQLFAMVAQRSRLDPFAKQIYAIKRGGRLTFQTGIDGFRSSAEETGEYRGSDEPEYGAWAEKPFGHPESARVTVHRVLATGEVIDQSFTAWWDEFYPGDQLGAQWKKMPRVMLAKCAEAGAFRRAFPKRFTDVYAHEEMEQAAVVADARPVAPTARARVAERRAAIEAGDQTRPGMNGPQGGDDARGSATAPPPDPSARASAGASAPDPGSPMPVDHAQEGPTDDVTADPAGTPGAADAPTARSRPGAADAPVRSRPGAAVRCEGFNADLGGKCRKEAGHEGPHRTEVGTWPA